MGTALAAALTVAMPLGCFDLSIAAIPPPPVTGDDVQSLVLALEAASLFEVYALRVSGGVIYPGALPIRLSRSVDPGTRVRVEALLYARSLEDLGLGVGLNVSSTSTGAGALPDGMPMLQLELKAGDDPGPWTEVGGRSAKLSAFRVEVPPDDCASFTIQREPLPVAAPITFAEQVEPGVAWVGNVFGETVQVTDAGIERVAAPSTRHLALFVPEPRTMWFGTGTNLLVRVNLRPEITIESPVRMPDPGEIHWVSGAPSASVVDVFVMTADRVVMHYDGTRSTIVDARKEPPSPGTAGGLAWVGPEEAIVGWPSAREVTRVKRVDGAWTLVSEMLPGATSSPTAVAYVPELGEVVATGDGEFFIRGEREWVLQPGRRLEQRPIYTIEAYRDGFVFGALGGVFGQYTPSAGFCTPLVLGREAIRGLAVMQGGGVIAIETRTGLTPEFIRVEPHR